MVVMDETEAQLLAALRDAPGDEATRALYADWLEQHGFGVRARFVRGEEVEAIGEVSDEGWRAITSRAKLCCEREACLGSWERLAATSESRVRACSVCERCPVYCVHVGEARVAGRRAHPAALDVMARRAMEIAIVEASVPPMTKVGWNPPSPRMRVRLPDPQPLVTACELLAEAREKDRGG
jgi:uncharacterized protein (TIGR02996 family)